MDILIPNIEVDLSKQDLTIMSIHPDGRVLYTPLKGKLKGKMRLTKMVELPPSYGRLCDLDSLIEHEKYNIEQALFDSDEVLEDLKNTPVILEANYGTDN